MTSFPFGSGAELTRLSDSAGGYIELIDYGAALRSVVVPDRAGRLVDVCLGYDTLEEYHRHDSYLGAIVGRCANRIAGASFLLNGRSVRLTPNAPPNHLHGGAVGFDKRAWKREAEGDAAVFRLRSFDGEEGYPGNLDVAVAYRFSQGLLSIDYEARCDADTPLNLTNHAYWDLGGQGSNDLNDCTLTLPADSFTEMGEGLLLTGRLLPVAGTPLDFTHPTPIAARLGDPYFAISGGYDHNFVLPPPGGDGLRPVGRAVSSKTGVALEISTTLPGVQLYTSNALAPRTGKGGVRYLTHGSFCLETQHFPDAVHHPAFPSPILRAGDVWRQRTEYRFSIEGV